MDQRDRKFGAAATKHCPFCGEEIKRVAVRCKHCHTDLKGPDEPDFNRGITDLDAEQADDFELRFLEYAYQSNTPIYVVAVAHALRLPSAEVSERLEEMAARDLLLRHVDDEGNVFFAIPGHTSRAPVAAAGAPGEGALARVPQKGQPPAPYAGRMNAVATPTETTAVAAMVLNVMIPGSGSLVAGRVATGIAQLMLWVVGVPLCLLFLMGVPLVMASWVWSLMTGVQIFEQSRRRQTPQ